MKKPLTIGMQIKWSNNLSIVSSLSNPKTLITILSIKENEKIATIITINKKLVPHLGCSFLYFES